MKKTKPKSGPKVRCALCADTIQSKSVHDYITCRCGAISIDGGAEYTKCSGNPDDFVWEVLE